MQHLKTFRIHAVSASFAILTSIALATGLSSQAAASDKNNTMDMPSVVSAASAPEIPATEDVTHPVLRLSPNDSKLLKLNSDAGMVVVGNPEHANIIADSARTLVVIPRRPGATFFTVLSPNGEIIMRRVVIIAGPEQNYVRVKNTCRASGDDTCISNNVYYCPDTCHEIVLSQEPTSVVEFEVSGNNNQGGGFTEDRPITPADGAPDVDETRFEGGDGHEEVGEEPE